MSKEVNEFDIFHNGYKDLHTKGLRNYNLWVEIGELILRKNFSKDDVLRILVDYENEFDTNGFLKLTYNNWDSISKREENKIWEELLKVVKKCDLDDSERNIRILRSKYTIERN